MMEIHSLLLKIWFQGGVKVQLMLLRSKVMLIEEVVLLGQVRDDDRIGNDLADMKLLFLGRRRVDPGVFDA